VIEFGKFNKLKVVKKVDFGLYLDGEEAGEILLPQKYVKNTKDIGDEINVFLYYDSEDRPIATTIKPKANVGDFAYLKVVSTTGIGAFLDWGLEKDLFVPINEQRIKLLRGNYSVVYIYIDERDKRIVASAKLDKFIDNDPQNLEYNQEVDLLIYKESDLGFNAIINNKYSGILFYNELLADLNIGEQIKGYIKKIREDGKIDLSMQKQGYEKIDDVSQKILDIIKSKGGVIYCNDKSDPDLIYSLFGESKRTYKMAVGKLFKNKIINIYENRIELIMGVNSE